MAMAFDTYVDLEDLGLGAPGHLSLYAERKEAGFWSVAEDITADQYVFGGEVEVEVAARARLRLTGGRFATDDDEEASEVGGAAEYDLTEAWSVKVGAEYLDKITPGDPDETGTTENGVVLGVHRHIGEHAKLGLGYEWGSVSDDLTDINYRNCGVFLNLVGKF